MGLFLSFEGVEGGGKSTLADRLADAFLQLGREVVRVREPGTTGLGEAIRSVVLAPHHRPVEPWAELFLMLAARAQLVTERIRPALTRDAVVLCDRFADASVAYQGHARSLGPEQVVRLNAIATQGCMPALTFVLDLDPREGRSRQTGTPDRMEQEEIGFHERVRAGYLAIAQSEPQRVKVLDASASADEVARAAWAAVAKLDPALPNALP